MENRKKTILKKLTLALLASLSSASAFATASSVSPSSPDFLFSPYKDLGISMNWNNYIISTDVTHTTNTPIVNILAPDSTLNWAFATGECGSENWAGVPADDFAKANVPSFTQAKMNYILAVGGAAGAFTCQNATGMKKFLDRYQSDYLAGLDFDIEGWRLSHDQIVSLVQSIAELKNTPDGPYAHLRISFTLATLAADDGSNANLNAEGESVIAAADAAGLKDYYVNLMTMDYGSASNNVCVLNEQGLCNMGASAIQAAKNFKLTHPNIPENRIEITPLIGINDIPDEIFTLEDAAAVSAYAHEHHLGGLHYWSFDRDSSCVGEGQITTLCNGYSTNSLEFMRAFSPS